MFIIKIETAAHFFDKKNKKMCSFSHFGKPSSEVRFVALAGQLLSTRLRVLFLVDTVSYKNL